MQQRKLGNPLVWFVLALGAGGTAYVYRQNMVATEKRRQEDIARRIAAEKAKLKEQLTATAPTKEEMEALFQQIYDSDAEIRWNSAQRIINQGGPQAISLLYTLINQDPDPAIRQRAFAALLQGNRSSKIVVDAVGIASIDSHPDIRLAAIGAMESLGNETHLPGLARPLGDTDPQMKEMSLRAITGIMKRTGRANLSRDIFDLTKGYLFDDTPAVRWHAWRLLDTARVEGMDRHLVYMLEQDPADANRFNALDAILRRLKGRQIVDFLLENVPNSDIDVQEKILNYLGKYAEPSDIEAVNRWTRFGEKRIRIAAMNAVSQIEIREKQRQEKLKEEIKAREAELRKQQQQGR